MKTRKKLIIPAAILIIILVVITFAPVLSVNVIFDRCMDSDELATVFRSTSFKAFQRYSLLGDGVEMSRSNNSQLLGTPLDGDVLEAALEAEPRDSGVIVLDGNLSLFDLIKIKGSPFVDTVIAYFSVPLIGDTDILPRNSTHYFEKHPEARYWE